MKTKEEKFVNDLDDLRDNEECTICLYIPYEKFQSFSFNEIEILKEQGSLLKFNKDLFQYVATKYNVNLSLL